LPGSEGEPPREESEAMKSMRAWRAAERKTMIESIEPTQIVLRKNHWLEMLSLGA
jgi:hypothetical protein